LNSKPTMKNQEFRVSQGAFTFIELLVVLTVCFLICCVAATGMAKAKTRVPGVGCLSNMRQLMVGWAMHSEENNGVLMPNGAAGQNPGWVLDSAEGWGNQPGNIDPSYYLNGPMGRYVSSNITVFRCPGDVVPSQNGQRLRSYSMNGQMGFTLNFNP